MADSKPRLRFLIAMLQVQSLAAIPSLEALRAALVEMAMTPISDGLDEVYEAVMRRIESHDPIKVNLAKKTLSYLICARCSWTVPELRHALTVDVGDSELDYDAMPSIDAIIAACEGLIVAVGRKQRDGEDQADNDADEAVRVQLVHRTAYEYLQRTREQWLPEAEKEMAMTCMAYLSLGDFRGGVCSPNLERRLQTWPLYYYAARHWDFHARAASFTLSDWMRMELEFFQSSSHIEAACEVVCQAGSWPQRHSHDVGFPRCMSGLHLASYFGITNLVRAQAGRAGVAINAKDSSGRTCLAWAAYNGHETTVEAILEAETTDLNTRDRHGRTPLSLAAKQSHTAIVEMLLDRGADPNLMDFSGETPLYHAVQEGCAAMVDLLVRYGVDVNAGETLSLAAELGQDKVVSLLLSQPSIRPWTKSERRKYRAETPCTPLWWAVTGKHRSIAEMLLSHVDVDRAIKMDREGEMLLHVVVEQGDEDMVRLLLRKGINVNARNNDGGNTPLHCAVMKGHHGVLKLLLSQPSAMPNLANKYGDTPASLAAYGDQIDALRLLLEKGVEKNKGQFTPLGRAAERRNVPIVELLLATDGVDADSRDQDGLTPLSLAASSRSENTYWAWGIPDKCPSQPGDVVQCLLNSSRVNVNSRDELGRTPLMHAVSDIRSLEILLDHEEVDVDAVDNQGRTALAWAIGKDRTKEAGAILLLERGADPTVGRYDPDETLLCCAVKSDKVGVATALVSHQAVDLMERDRDGETALCWAAATGKVEMVDKLLGAGGIDVNTKCDSGDTLLIHAASGWSPTTGVASLLLAMDKVDVNARDKRGRIALHHAAQTAKEALVSLLLESGTSDPDSRDLKGRTPLSFATSVSSDVLKSSISNADVLKIIERLLSLKEVNPDAKDMTGRTPLSWAVEASQKVQEAVVKRLLNTAGVDPNAEDENGWTPLSWAVQGKNVGDLIGALLTAGAGRIDINHEDRKGRTPLALALEAGGDVTISQLRAAGAILKPTSGTVGEDPCALMDSRQDEGRGQGAEARQEETKQNEDAAQDTESSSWEISSQYHQFPPMHFSGGARSILWLGEYDIELGAQAEDDELDVGNGVKGEEAALCAQCETLGLDRVFSRSPADGIATLATLGKVDESWTTRQCAMCCLIAAVRPRVGYDVDSELCVYSSTSAWLSRSNSRVHDYFKSNWVDTVILGLEYGSSAYSADSAKARRYGSVLPWMWELEILRFGFIGRIGSNDRGGVRSLTVHRLQADKIDFRRARSWINTCAKHHGKRCSPGARRHIPFFRLIDCETRDIVDGQSKTDHFVALSYVWGPSSGQTGTVNHSHVGKGHAQRVVEDAICVTLALGYRYLWVDRHCITNEHQEIRQAQLLSMDAVYENAEVTIVAAAGQNSAFGLPGVSIARAGQPCAKIQGHAVVAVPGEPCENIKRSAWWTRGWTFQEGVLSRRRLFFTEHEVSYECPCMVARESIELPLRIHRVAATQFPMFEHARVFTTRSLGWSRGDRLYIWSRIKEYTERHLTHDYDILNAILGVMQTFARRDPPVYHLCGIPLVRQSFAGDNATLLEAFASGLCWELKCGTRREGFPSWSWVGWKGVVLGALGDAAVSQDVFGIEVSMVPPEAPSQIVSWAEFEAMDPEERASLPQNYHLRITATAAEVSFHRESPDESDWYSILYNGDAALEGSVHLCRDPVQDADFGRRLDEERWSAILLGTVRDYSNALVLLIVEDLGHCWERVGFVKVDRDGLFDFERGGFSKQTFLLG